MSNLTPQQVTDVTDDYENMKSTFAVDGADEIRMFADQGLIILPDPPSITTPGGCTIDLHPAPTQWWTNICYLAYLFVLSQYIQDHNNGEIDCETLKALVNLLGQLFKVCNGGAEEDR